MEKSSDFGFTLRHNYLQLLFVFAAFTLMVVVAYFSIGTILRSRLYSEAENLLSSADANVEVGLSEAKTTLLYTHQLVQGMVERNASRQEILEYLTATTEWMRSQDQGLLRYYGIYGYIHGEFYDSINLNPGEDYIPQRRPWYQWAIREGDTVAYTTPYRDWRTGDSIISIVRNIDINDELVGILAVDVNINRLVEYVNSQKLTPEGYGILLSHNMTFMAHPDRNLWGHQLEEQGGAYEEIARILRSGNEVKERRVKNSNGAMDIVFFRKIFNNWYVGIVTPNSRFYRDLNISLRILIVLGLTLSLALCYILLRLSSARMRAAEESKSKSSFLASMSHEIRTPMNAITGMAELALREDMPDTAREHVLTIKQASANLLAIINDILDFSKIESGKLEIIPSDYSFSSLVNDVISIIRMKVIDSHVCFAVSIDSNIPNILFGDETRIRQIFLNVLNNAFKYTEEGFVTLSVTGEIFRLSPIHEDTVTLTIKVADSGRGIKQEDIDKLFVDFVQLDVASNRGIEGTGLGLAITRSMIMAMDGNITVESEYGKGSVFTITLPQKIRDYGKLASVDNPGKKRILVYELREVYAGSIVYTIENLGVEFSLAESDSDFCEKMSSGNYSFAFIASNLYENVRDICSKFETDVRTVLLTGFGEAIADKNSTILNMPIYSIPVANILNGIITSSTFSANRETVVRFTAPEAKVLVVDDISTNLKVAEGLLLPYKIQVELCNNGPEAIEAVKSKDFDLVFMDHMMPDMNGIEATAMIRAMEEERFKTMPIIALTANAIVGMQEMFIEKGFNDFLAKPIDISKLDETLDHWIPKEKREWDIEKRDRRSRNRESGSACDPNTLNIPGVNVQHGIFMTGGTEAGYRDVLSFFQKDAEMRLPVLQNEPSADTMSVFTTQVHALKSAASSIGAEEVSSLAAELEAAGKAGDILLIREKLSFFTGQLNELATNINKALSLSRDRKGIVADNDRQNDISEYLPIFNELADALKFQNASEIDRILDELNKKQLNRKTKEVLDRIADDVLMADFDKAEDALISLLERR